MKVEFQHNDVIITTVDLEIPVYEEDIIKIFNKNYVVWETYHDIEIDDLGVHEKIVCDVITEEEREECDKK